MDRLRQTVCRQAKKSDCKLIGETLLAATRPELERLAYEWLAKVSAIGGEKKG